MNRFQERIQEFSKNRIFILLCSIFILFMVLILRLFSLQIIHGEEYDQKLTTSILRKVNSFLPILFTRFLYSAFVSIIATSP